MPASRFFVAQIHPQKQLLLSNADHQRFIFFQQLCTLVITKKKLPKVAIQSLNI